MKTDSSTKVEALESVFMTLRFDKYFTGQTGAGTFASDPGTIDLNAYIRQADAAYVFLRGQPAADRQHMAASLACRCPGRNRQPTPVPGIR